jgi:hypothetical protein
MFSMVEAEMLKTIFSDADLVDLDCSQWDTAISIYAIADHLPSPKPGKRCLVAVRFLGVQKLEWTFQHHHFTNFPLKEDDPESHTIVLSGGEQFPILRITFEDVEVDQIPHSIFAAVNPQWANLSLGMGRPGIEALHKLFTRPRDR